MYDTTMLGTWLSGSIAMVIHASLASWALKLGTGSPGSHGVPSQPPRALHASASRTEPVSHTKLGVEAWRRSRTSHACRTGKKPYCLRRLTCT